MYYEFQDFITLRAWKAAAKKQGMKVKLVTRSKKNNYWQATAGKFGVCGFFNTQYKFGRLNKDLAKEYRAQHRKIAASVALLPKSLRRGK